MEKENKGTATERGYALHSALVAEFCKLVDTCRDVVGNDPVSEREIEDVCTDLTRRIRKVREALTDCRRG